MVNLKLKPYYLNDEQIRWVEENIQSMTTQEKIGQLFIDMVSDRSPKALEEVIAKYHPGGIRYHSDSAEAIYQQNSVLQNASRIPLLIAANCEMGGNGAVKGGTAMACGSAIAATNDEKCAYETARVGVAEGAAIGCNWNFAPVVDLTYNWRNTIVQRRAFNHNPDDVIRYSRAFLKGVKTQDWATCIKHFPGDGTEENDQHLLMGVNEMSCEEWDNSFGKVYKELIDDGVMTIMAGHIALPAYSSKLRPGIAEVDIRPATLAPELISGLLKEQLGFNGLVVTDASHMIGLFGASVPRSEQVPGTIAAGCDMFLFFNDREEDFNFMMDGYKNGIVSEERLNDALHRILGIKAALNLHTKKAEGKLMPPKEKLAIVGCKEHHQASAELADKYVTLVKDRDNYLPLTPEKHRRLKLIFIGAEDFVIGGNMIKSNSDEIKADVIKSLTAVGFSVDSEDISRGKTADFKAKYDAVLLVLAVDGFAQYNTMRNKWGTPAMQPWYISELPTVVMSLTLPNLMIDVPMAHCYINAHMNHPEAINAAVDKITGKSPFKGNYDENVFCGRWETRF